MNKIEYFSKVMQIVTELMDVTQQEILSASKAQEVVDARWLVFFLMKERGYRTSQIAVLTSKPTRTINHGIRMIEDRARYNCGGIGNTLAKARQMLGNFS
jgi:chromosomal replication initiation ATPase DnaA